MRREAVVERLRPLRAPGPALLLAMLVSADLLLILAHLGQKFLGRPGAPFYDLGVDHSWGELYLYLKWIWLAALCVVIWRRLRAPVFLALSAVCAVLYVEDAFRAHERVGWALDEPLTRRFEVLEGRRMLAFQVGELLWLAGVTVVIVVLLGVGWWRTDGPRRRHIVTLLACFALFAFFSVVIDTWHSLYVPGSTADRLLTALEDGGEVASMSPAVAFAFALAHHRLDRVDQDRSEAVADDEVTQAPARSRVQ